MELLEGLLAGFEAGVGVEEGVEAGSVGFVELVASAQQRASPASSLRLANH